MSRSSHAGSLPPNAPRSGPRVEVIDLTLSPSPPPRSPRLQPSRPREQDPVRRRRHTPYDSQIRRRRSPSRQINAEVIDLDDFPEPEPGRQPENRDQRRSFFSRGPSSDFEVTIAHARVRPPGGDPFDRFDGPQRDDHPPQAVEGATLPPLRDLYAAPFNPGSNVNLGGISNLWNFNWQIGLGMGGLGVGFFGQRAAAPPIAPQRNPPMGGNFMLFQPPGDLAYNQVPAFVQPEEDLEIVGQHHPEDKPIKPAREGFTRSPKSEDAIGCSRCDQELGDSDDDIKKQIWVMKCGHCYCGECANFMLSRPPARAPKRGKRSYHFCDIEGCKQHAQGKRFIWEIYV